MKLPYRRKNPGHVAQRVLARLRQSGGPLSCGDLACEMGQPYGYVHETLRALVVRGDVRKLGYRQNVLWTLKGSPVSAASYTSEEEARYRLPSLPDVPFIGHAEASRRNVIYEEGRVRYRQLHPLANPLTGKPM